MITEKAPGKLFIAGEYAVLEQNCPAILVAVNEFVSVSISKSHTSSGLIYSKQYSQASIHWVRKGNQMVIDNRDNPFEYILAAIKFTEQYCLEQNVEMSVYDLHVNSELDSADGKKYGLGSSAAVTVATVKAILKFYGLNCTSDLIYKLAAIAHYSIQGNGSAGDIAASVYGGWIAYQTFDKKWLTDELKIKSLSTILSSAWPGLHIQILTPPKNMKLLIGWTQTPASTSQLVDKTNAKKVLIKSQYEKFLINSRNCVLQIIEGFKENNIKQIQHQIRINRLILQNFAKSSNIAIEILKLTDLIETAEQFGGAAKTSGAGNGDCGIVIADCQTKINELTQTWKEHGILQLDFHVHSITK